MSTASNVSDTNTWLVMLYIAADDLSKNSTEDSIQDDCCAMLDALETMSTQEVPALAEQVTIVALYDNNMDRGQNTCGPPIVKTLTSGQPWTDRTADIKAWAGNLFSAIGDSAETDELNTGDYQTLSTFIRWSLDQYSATYTMLAVIGHGGGWSPTWPRSEASDGYVGESSPTVAKANTFTATADTAVAPEDNEWQKRSWAEGANGLCPDYTSLSAISTKELGLALKQGLAATPQQQSDSRLNVVFLDACLMGMIEIVYELHEYADVLIAGENLLWPSLPYDKYLASTQLNSQTRPANLATTIVQLYNAEVEQKSWSIAAIDLSNSEALQQLIQAIDELATSIITASTDNSDLDHIFNAYLAAQKFDYDGDVQIEMAHDAYVDLQDFATQLQNRFDKASEVNRRAGKLKQRAQTLIRSIKPQPKSSASTGLPAPVSTSSQPQHPSFIQMKLDNAYGLSIYLPLGEKDSREIPVSPAVGSAIKYFECYNKEHLRFAQAAPNWVDMVKILTQKLWPTQAVPVPDPASYRTPRLQVLPKEDQSA